MPKSMWIRLLAWYREHGRDLPWRKTRDPYRILVSEIMLQQTQVRRVLEYYPRLLKQFPDWKALSQASTAELLQAWAGLGYNRRALALRSIAQYVVEHGEPNTYEGWLSLKGIGPYTAAAVSLFSDAQRVLPIDTNVRRVLGRTHLGVLFPQISDDEAIRKAIGVRWRVGEYLDIPQAIFDLANAHCLKQPECGSCPLRADCKSSKRFLSGKVKAPRRTVVKAQETVRPGKRYPDRIYRGRLLQEVRLAKTGIRVDRIGPSIDSGFDSAVDSDWLLAMITRMMRDGLVRQEKGRLFLPRE